MQIKHISVVDVWDVTKKSNIITEAGGDVFSVTYEYNHRGHCYFHIFFKAENAEIGSAIWQALLACSQPA